MEPTENLNVRSAVPLITPDHLKEELPLTEQASQTVVASREVIKRLLSGADQRLLVVVGPCSIHDPQAGLDYAVRLKTLADQFAQRMVVLMRIYFEKPRTTVGWKGLINDPHLDDSLDIATGLRRARHFLLEVVGRIGLPAASEMLDPVTPQYMADLVTWASIGARTTESPIHRQMASGLSMPVGYKNGTDGSFEAAINAMLAARGPHAFVGIDSAGHVSLINTKGNPWGHLILRGGRSGPNYSPGDLAEAAARLEKADLPTRLMVDCSHANSNKDYRKQPEVWSAVLEQRLSGNNNILGMMLESNLQAGNQKVGTPSELSYGQSITDGCLGWEQTEELLGHTYDRLSCLVTTQN